MSENMAKVEEEAKLEAQADAISTPEQEEEKKFAFLKVKLSKTYDLDGKEIDEIDLSGLRKMTTLDMQAVDVVLEQMGRNPFNKFKDTLYLKHLAVRATGYPVEFFNKMSMRDINEITVAVRYYFFA